MPQSVQDVGIQKQKGRFLYPSQTDRQHLTSSQLSTKSEVVTSTEHARPMIRRGLWPIYRLGKKAIRIDVEEIKQIDERLPRACEGELMTSEIVCPNCDTITV